MGSNQIDTQFQIDYYRDPSRSRNEGVHIDSLEVFYCEELENLELSVQQGVWATQRSNETKLNEAFDSVEHVILIFLVNRTRNFQLGLRAMKFRQEKIWRVIIKRLCLVQELNSQFPTHPVICLWFAGNRNATGFCRSPQLKVALVASQNASNIHQDRVFKGTAFRTMTLKNVTGLVWLRLAYDELVYALTEKAKR